MFGEDTYEYCKLWLRRNARAKGNAASYFFFLWDSGVKFIGGLYFEVRWKMQWRFLDYAVKIGWVQTLLNFPSEFFLCVS